MENSASRRTRRRKKKSTAVSVTSPPESAAGTLTSRPDDPGTTADLLAEAFASFSGGNPDILLRSPTDSAARGGGRRKEKKVAAATGLVANVIGKEYGCAGKSEGGISKSAGFCHVAASREEAEEFLRSTLGGSCDLDPAVVKDVFGQSGYDVEKALDTLLEMCDSSQNTPIKTAKESEDEMFWSYKNTQNEDSSKTKISPDELQQNVLESLFNSPSSSKQESKAMNWKKALKNIEAFSLNIESSPILERDHSRLMIRHVAAASRKVTHPGTVPGQARLPTEFRRTQVLDNELYSIHCDHQFLLVVDIGEDSYASIASRHWSTMKSYFEQAGVAYSKGNGAHASYLSEKGKIHRKLAQVADEKTSQEIFEARNKDIRNALTIDLHGQHVKQAMRLLKVHLLMLTYMPSVNFLRVITGCGLGRLKQSVTGLLKREGLSWSEENSGTLIIRIERSKEYSFMDEDSDGESS